MPILYESTDAVVSLSTAPTKPSMQTRRTGRLQQPAEAPKWEVTQEWAMNGIYLTVDNAFGIVKANVIKACAEKTVKLESIWIEKAWAVWKGFWTEYHMIVKYTIVPMPSLAAPVIGYAVVAALVALAALGIVIVIGIWLVTSTIQAILEIVPPALKPIVGTAIGLGLGLLAIGGGVYLITKILPKKPAQPAPPPPMY